MRVIIAVQAITGCGAAADDQHGRRHDFLCLRRHVGPRDQRRHAGTGGADCRHGRCRPAARLDAGDGGLGARPGRGCYGLAWLYGEFGGYAALFVTALVALVAAAVLELTLALTRQEDAQQTA